MALQLFDFPPELILHILCFLDLSELSVLQRTHSTFRQLIQDSPGLQYRYAAALSGVETNVHSTHTASECLALLKNRENAWLHMQIGFQRSIPSLKLTSGIYDLTGGMYFKGDLSRRSIHYCRLPSRPSDAVTWKTINVDKELVDFGVAVYEHDLIAILTYTPHPTITGQSRIELVLLELSTGRPHPLAKNPVLFVCETRASRPAILIEIVGEHLVLVMTHTFREFNVPDTLRVYEWKTGTLKMIIERLFGTYHEIIFLSSTIILLANSHLNTLDAWEIPTGTMHAPTQPFLTLALPSLELGSLIMNFTCRCEPNPTPSGTPHLSAPFHHSPEDAIVVLNTRIHGPEGVGAYSLFVRRSDLLKVCTTERPEDEDGVSHYIPSSFSIERIPGKRVRAWDDWGPPITRVFDTSRSPMSLNWVTTTAGQRAIVRQEYDSDNEDEDDDDDSEDDEVHHLQLLDFNPLTVKRVVRYRNDYTREFDFHEVMLDQSESIVPGIHHPIRSQLPYVGIDIPFHHSWVGCFKGYLLYEEGFLILLDGDGEEVRVVLHVGV